MVDVYGLFQLNKVNKPKPENLVAHSLDWSDPLQKSCIRTVFPHKLIWTFDQAKGMSMPASKTKTIVCCDEQINSINFALFTMLSRAVQTV